MADSFRFSDKQRLVLDWWRPGSPHYSCDAIICDGAVRSGKTLCLSLGFVLWSMASFQSQNFALCGKTAAAVRRNLALPLSQRLSGLGFACTEKLSRGYWEISLGSRRNRYYLFGGQHEGSAAHIQGLTLAGVLLDEVALMPRSFVEQAIARCSVEGSRFWFSCNPDHPAHWFYTEWIQQSRQKKALYLHFTMADNPGLAPAVKKRYEALYSGAFYERFVLGRWSAPQGLVYPMFRPEQHVVQVLPAVQGPYYISCDYGTVNPMSMGLWGQHGGVWYRMREFYHDARLCGVLRTDEEYYAALEELAGELPIRAVIVDPSAASFLQCVRSHGRFCCMPARNDVAAGVRRVADLLQTGKLRFDQSCRDTLREFSLYCWDPERDAPKKEHDHAMDDLRYFVMTALERPRSGFYATTLERGVI